MPGSETSDVAGIILLIGGMYYFARYVWLFRLSKIWHERGHLNTRSTYAIGPGEKYDTSGVLGIKSTIDRESRRIKRVLERQERPLESLLRFGGVFAMTIATMVLLGAYIIQHDNSRTIYILLVFAIGGPFIDISFNLFPSRGTLCFITSLVLFVNMAGVKRAPAYWYSGLLVIFVACVGVIFAPHTKPIL